MPTPHALCRSDAPAAVPRVSVIVPTVRVDRYFKDAIASLRDQTLSDIEIVVVLDGVPDDVRLPEDPRLRIVRLARRQGTPRALNAGLAVARGAFIARLDADDVAEPERLARQVDELVRHPDLLGVGSAARLIDSDGRIIGDIATDGDEIPAARLLRHNVFIHSSMTMRREALLAVGGYDPRCRRMQDYDLWLRLSLLGPLANLSEHLTRYRVHEGMHSRITPPIGPSAAAVRRSRVALARHLGRSTTGQHLRNALWTVAQFARHARFRRPRYLTR